MTILSLAENRKELVNAISSITGNKMVYQGPPTFSFSDGVFTVRKEGSLEVENIEENVGVLRSLAAMKLIEDDWDADKDRISIDLPLESYSVHSLMNILLILWSKEELINKAVGSRNGFMISEDFVRNLREEPPTSVSEFLFSWEQAGGEEVTKGISFNEERISFTGFPYTEDAEWGSTYTELAAAIGKEAQEVKNPRLSKADAENEKYYFRVWLIRLGLGGDDHKICRKKLLANLSGNSAFRTEEQREIHLQKHGRRQE